MAAGKLILTYPIWKGELSFGSEATSTKSHGNNYNQENIIPAADNEMKEKNIAGFAEYQLSLNCKQSTVNFNVGLRYEHVADRLQLVWRLAVGAQPHLQRLVPQPVGSMAERISGAPS